MSREALEVGIVWVSVANFGIVSADVGMVWTDVGIVWVSVERMDRCWQSVVRCGHKLT